MLVLRLGSARLLPSLSHRLASGLRLHPKTPFAGFHIGVGCYCGNRTVCVVVSFFMGAWSLHAALLFFLAFGIVYGDHGGFERLRFFSLLFSV